MKRLRKRVRSRIRFFHCGEYGDMSRRPHYHAVLFGFDPPDKQRWTVSASNPLYISPLLNETWGMGFVTVGEVSFESAAYVARYCVKKITGAGASSHYKGMNPETGELFDLEPEYCTMSRNPGIGKKWFERFSADVYPDDFIVVGGVKMRPPRAFDKYLEVLDGDLYDSVKYRRVARAIEFAEDCTPERLADREKVTKLRLSLNHRGAA